MLNIGSGKETKAAYEQLVAALDEFVRKTFNDWAVMDSLSSASSVH